MLVIAKLRETRLKAEVLLYAVDLIARRYVRMVEAVESTGEVGQTPLTFATYN